MSEDEFDEFEQPFDFNLVGDDPEYRRLISAEKARQLTNSTTHRNKLSVVKGISDLIKTATFNSLTQITLSNAANDPTSFFCQALVDNPNDQILLTALGYTLTTTVVGPVTSIVVFWGS